MVGNFCFNKTINGWKSWGEVFQNMAAFEPLAEKIFALHGLPFAGLAPCAPGSNAVFRAGEYVVKIYAPQQSGVDCRADHAAESFGLRHAQAVGVAAPHIAAAGCLTDRYDFLYTVTEYIPGMSFAQCSTQWNQEQKQHYGAQLRAMIQRLNVPCVPFAPADAGSKMRAQARWQAFSTEFLQQKQVWLARLQGDASVFVHGDLNPDNIQVGNDGLLYLMDFGDARLGHPLYEVAPLAELFAFDRSFLYGYFGPYDARQLTDTFVQALLLHDFGYNLIRDSLGEPLPHSVDELWEAIYTRIA